MILRRLEVGQRIEYHSSVPPHPWVHGVVWSRDEVRGCTDCLLGYTYVVQVDGGGLQQVTFDFELRIRLEEATS
jgi:hypothetical protein